METEKPATQWYCAIDNARRGPVSPQELKRFAIERKLKREDLVWNESSPEWTLAEQIKGPFPTAPPAMPVGAAAAGVSDQ